MKNICKIFLFSLSLTTVSLFAQPTGGNPALKLDFPLFDLPYQIEAGNAVGHGFFVLTRF